MRCIVHLGSFSLSAHTPTANHPCAPCITPTYLADPTKGHPAAQGLQQHMEASHDLFDFSYSLGGVDMVPSVNVRCPAELYDQQGNLQNPEAADVADFNVTDCKVSTSQ